MLLNLDRLFADGALDPKLKEVTTNMRKYAVEQSKSQANSMPLMSIILTRHGVMKESEVISFLNSRPDNKVTYIHNQANYKPINLKELNLKVAKAELENATYKFYEMGLFPFRIVGDGIIWLAREIDDSQEIMNKLFVAANTFGYGLLGNKERFRNNNIEYAVGTMFERYFHQFCMANELPNLKSKMFVPDPHLMCAYYIIKGILLNASDIYMDPKAKGIRISYSIYNDYLLDDMLYFTPERSRQFLDQVLTLAAYNAQDRTKDRPLIDLSIKNLGDLDNKYNGRVNVLKANELLDSICIRVVDKSKKAIPFELLKISPARKAAMEKLMHNNSGLIVIAGATGSGKTTTAFSLLDLLRRMFKFKRIESTEGPVEQVIEEISQIDIEEAGVSYEVVAEGQTRRNLQISYVGEFNSPKTIWFGVDSVIRNSLLMTTMHTIDGAFVPDRVRSLTTGDTNTYELFLQVLRGIIHQAMLKEVCPDCSSLVNINEDDRITNDMKKVLRYYKYYDDKVLLVNEKPNCNCKKCNGRGFLITKPIIVSEVFMVDDYIRQEIQALKPSEIYFFIYEKMRVNGETEIQDALEYMKQKKLDWLQIWDRLSLCNKVSTALAPGDEAHQEETADNIEFTEHGRTMYNSDIDEELFNGEG